ncbi:MAG: hypothetical protein KF841_10395 [Phycisphaerae bacterium]|nr:hypothetical protein [Phycisphaerae bacterium]
MTKKMLTWVMACSVAALAVAPAFADGKKGTAVIKGKVVLDPSVTAPKVKPLAMKADATCEKENPKAVPDQSLIVYASEGNAVPYVFIQITKGIDDKYDAPETPVVLDQQGCVYHPHVMGMVAGQGIDIVNSDPVNHNIHSLAKKNPQFNFAQPNKDMKKELRGKETFSKPEIVKIKCDVHGWMAAYVGVVAHPFFAVTVSHESDGGDKAKRGTFEIKDLPAGKFELEFWHETFGVVKQEVEVKDGETKEIEVKIGGKKALAPTFREVEITASNTNGASTSDCCRDKSETVNCHDSKPAVDVAK